MTGDAVLWIDPLTPWGAPARLSALTIAGDNSPSATADLREVYFTRNGDVFRMTRADASTPFDAPAIVAELSTGDPELDPEVSADGLTLYLVSNRATTGSLDIYISTRAARTDTWSSPTPVDELTAGLGDRGPSLSYDGLSLVFASERMTAGNLEVYETRRASASDPWGPAMQLASLASVSTEQSPVLSADRLAIYFQSSFGGDDVRVATRPTLGDPFGASATISIDTTNYYEGDPWVSPDGRTLLFVTNRASGMVQLYIATR